MKPRNLRPALFALVIAAALPLAGCGGGGGTVAAPVDGNLALPLSRSAINSSSLTMTIAENQSTIAPGGSVVFTLSLTNNTAKTITYTGLTSGSTQVSQVAGRVTITGPTGATVYPPAGPIAQFLALTPNLTLTPGQTISGTVTVSGVFTTAGTYLATATFDSDMAVSGASGSAGPLKVQVL